MRKAGGRNEALVRLLRGMGRGAIRSEDPTPPHDLRTPGLPYHGGGMTSQAARKLRLIVRVLRGCGDRHAYIGGECVFCGRGEWECATCGQPVKAGEDCRRLPECEANRVRRAVLRGPDSVSLRDQPNEEAGGGE